MKVPFYQLPEQLDSRLNEKLQRITNNVINSGNYILGPETEFFENRFASFCGVDYCVFLSSGTDALILALKFFEDFNIKDKTRTYTSSASFFATTEAIFHNNRRPCFVDINLETAQLDVNILENKICNGDVVIPVGLYGSIPDLIKLKKLKQEFSFIILDAAQLVGVKIEKDNQLKSLLDYCDVACFSFYPGKNLGGITDGGAIVTNNKRIYEFAKQIRNHGQKNKGEHLEIGYNTRGSEINAAVLSEKLTYIPEWNRARKEIANRYYHNLGGNKNIRLLKIEDYVRPNHHIFPIFIKDRNKIKEKLKEFEIFTGIHYETPIHKTPALEMKGYLKLNELNNTEKLFDEELSLPMYVGLTWDQIDYVCEKLNEIVKE